MVYHDWKATLIALSAEASGHPADPRPRTDPHEERKPEQDNKSVVRSSVVAEQQNDAAFRDLALESAEAAPELNDRIEVEISASPEVISAAQTIQRAFRRFLQRRYNRAAIIILKAYRRYHSRKNVRLSKKEESRSRWRNQCLKMASGLRREYRAPFVCQLPYALACLEMLYSHLSKRRDDAKRRLSQKGVDLDYLQKDLQQNV